MARSRRSVTTLALVGVLALAACSGESDVGPGGQPRPSSAAPSSTAPTSAAAAPTTWSAVSPGVVPQAVSRRITKAWSVRWPQLVLPFASNAEASPIVASVTGEDFSGIAQVDTATGRIVSKIDAFEDPKVSQAMGTTDDGYALWVEFTSASFGSYLIKAWDRSTGRVSKIGASLPVAGDGNAYPSLLQTPVLTGHLAAWVQRPGRNRAREIVVVDLRTGHKKVVRRGHIDWVSTFGQALVWAESSERDGDAELRAMDAMTLEPTTVPTSLANLGNANSFVSDGEASAWIANKTDPTTGNSIPSLVVSPTRTSPGRTVLTLDVGGFSPPLLVTPTSVVAQMSQGGVIVVDRRTGRYVRHAGVYGAAQAGPNVLLTGSSQKHPTGGLAILSPADAADIDAG